MQTGESYLGCHIHVNALVSRRIQPESGGCGCDNNGPVCMCERIHRDGEGAGLARKFFFLFIMNR